MNKYYQIICFIFIAIVFSSCKEDEVDYSGELISVNITGARALLINNPNSYTDGVNIEGKEFTPHLIAKYSNDAITTVDFEFSNGVDLGPYLVYQADDSNFIITFSAAKKTYLIDKMTGKAKRIAFVPADKHDRILKNQPVHLVGSGLFYKSVHSQIMLIENIYDLESEGVLIQSFDFIEKFEVNNSNYIVVKALEKSGVIEQNTNYIRFPELVYAVWKESDDCLYFITEQFKVSRICSGSIENVTSINSSEDLFANRFSKGLFKFSGYVTLAVSENKVYDVFHGKQLAFSKLNLIGNYISHGLAVGKQGNNLCLVTSEKIILVDPTSFAVNEVQINNNIGFLPTDVVYADKDIILTSGYIPISETPDTNDFYSYLFTIKNQQDIIRHDENQGGFVFSIPLP